MATHRWPQNHYAATPSKVEHPSKPFEVPHLLKWSFPYAVRSDAPPKVEFSQSHLKWRTLKAEFSLSRPKWRTSRSGAF
ncbi:hypothetical protein JCGZ_09348 [Jatropha curcas]|uniref:Uncharacterized protein n=1 Tax=Jatropha curcas TaxID=180498 RepID=A0A067KNA9_JATCU|nr:hypothetical protein JCGZ_09348 [Jatropha curcas]